MRVSLVLMFWMLCPAVVMAGPWAREKGSNFVSLSFSASVPQDDPSQSPEFFGTLYLERGVGRDLTLGFDVGVDENMDYTSLFFMRRPIGAGDSAHRFSLQVGGGAAVSNGISDYLAHAGASWGRGFETQFGSAWAVVDLSMQYRFMSEDVVTKADLTVGVKPSDRTKIMLQLQTGDYPGSDPYVRFAPSIARKFGERVHVELGAQFGVVNDDRMGLKLGTWLEF